MNPTEKALIEWVPLILPEIILVGGACVLFLGGTFRAGRDRWGTAALLVLAAAGAAAALGPGPGTPTEAALFASPVLLDYLAAFTRAVALVGGAILVLLSWNEVPDRHAAEYHACLLVIAAGTSLVGAANELVTLFLVLEMISIPTYVLLYLPRHDQQAQEAAMKYFLLSVFSSALLLFGFSYLYGLSGTTNLPGLTQALASAGAGGLPPVALLALVMVVAGLGFRITAVPFHFYAPDVYQGTATPAAALLAFVPKVAGFVALIRVLGFAPPLDLLADAEAPVYAGLVLGRQVSTLFWILAAVTMTLGNMLALWQDNLKRLLAYSSVAHAGYMLMGLAVPQHLGAGAGSFTAGVEAVLFYLVAYGAMTVGAFSIIAYLHNPQRPVETVDDLGGLSRSHPRSALAMALFLFSLIGIPLTAGFLGKLLLFLAVLGVPAEALDVASLEQARLFRILALVAAINAAIGAWYYLRICAVMYLRNPLRPPQEQRRAPVLAAIGACAVLTLALGIYPPPLLRSVDQAVPKPPATAAADR